eukprot:4834577-Lingulodinium_polyedra.AAC.1
MFLGSSRLTALRDQPTTWWPTHGVRTSQNARRCVSECMSEQLSRESCSEMRSEMHAAAAAPRMSRFAHSMRQPPCGGR